MWKIESLWNLSPLKIVVSLSQPGNLWLGDVCLLLRWTGQFHFFLRPTRRTRHRCTFSTQGIWFCSYIDNFCCCSRNNDVCKSSKRDPKYWWRQLSYSGPPCMCGFGVREKIRCGLRFFGVFLCGFAVLRFSDPPYAPLFFGFLVEYLCIDSKEHFIEKKVLRRY